MKQSPFSGFVCATSGGIVGGVCTWLGIQIESSLPVSLAILAGFVIGGILGALVAALIIWLNDRQMPGRRPRG